MASSVWVKAAAAWLAILVLAIVNGALREKVLIPAVGSVSGLAGSGIILSICIFAVAFITVPWYGLLARRQWFLLGLFWSLLTVAFEFSFGFFVQHKSLDVLLDAYMFRGGDIWPIVLIVTFISPWLAARVRNSHGAQ